jgi:hypothetical protein
MQQIPFETANGVKHDDIYDFSQLSMMVFDRCRKG